MITININLNTVVKFQLTTTGRRILEEHYRSLDLNPPKESFEYSMPLWEAMNIFGRGLYMGAPESPFVKNNLEVE